MARRAPILLKAFLVVAGIYTVIRYLIHPPLPFSLVFMYMVLTLTGTLIYVSIYEENWHSFYRPIIEFIRGQDRAHPIGRAVRKGVLILVPLWVGWAAYQQAVPSFIPPAEPRVIHPAPPIEVTGLYNPLRAQPEQQRKYIQEGARIYFQNCFFCHGDRLDGEGLFAHGLNLPPANFMDPGTIAQLQESFVFWRISKGGPGLPAGSTPWNSAMPRWEEILSEQDRWKVILFLYDFTGWKPRTWE